MGEIAASISIPFLQLEQGEALLLDGPSGSGKTTVLHMISGLLSADSGSIYFAGEDVSKLPTAQRDIWRADNVGYIFQRLNLLDELNVLENILLPQCWRKEKNKQALRQRALALLEQVGLAQKAPASPGNSALVSSSVWLLCVLWCISRNCFWQMNRLRALIWKTARWFWDY